MGIGAADLNKLANFKRQGILGDVRSVFEIGSQELYCKGSENAIADLFEAFGQAVPRKNVLERLADLGSGRDLFTLLGLEYGCIDTDGKHGALAIDLNYDSVPAPCRNKYDLVTNLGTTEHVANQFNCFQVIHDLTRPGGVMYHDLTFTGYETHGLFNYTPKFFWRLSQSNFYDYLGMWVGGSGRQRFLHPDVLGECKLEHGLTESNFSHQDGCLRVFVRKRFDIPFVPPLDVPNPLEMPESSRRRYWTMTEPAAFDRCLAGEHPALGHRIRKRAPLVRRLVKKLARSLKLLN